ncbi:hypothetical protein, partial [Ectothiorhodospira lacustris]|uniref:hypothetical protein n=1 Tax=Ectothiorhodospira lacustris TaxID=2899127 RepID=UPI001EE7B312
MSLVYFYFKSQVLLNDLECLDVNRDWHYFTTGVKCWCSQTYLQLRSRGYNVKAVHVPPERGVVCCHADDLHSLLTHPACSDAILIVCFRADRPPQLYADFEVVQNQWSAKDARCCFIPHWPQPNLLKRDVSRSNVKTIGYKGDIGNLHPWFHTKEWLCFMKDNNLIWDLDTSSWGGGVMSHFTHWNDYSSVDLVVSVRKDLSSNSYHKPASKLINAWHAGVPAILGSEISCSELRITELDYVEINEVQEIKRAILDLKADNDRYLKMIENG